MDADLKQAWVDTLREGGFTQTKETLHNGIDDGYCCLGVLCEVAIVNDAGIETDENHETFWTTKAPSRYQSGRGINELTQAMRHVLGLTSKQHSRLIQLNDQLGKNFSEIADWIDKYV